MTPIERFQRNYQIIDDCWIWQKSKFNNGYAQFKVEGINQGAHRWAYLYFKGEISEGLVIDHLCRNRDCVNPDHLEAVTQRENVMRGEGLAAKLAKVTICPKGHPYDETNGGIRKNGHRYCRACHNAEGAKWRAKRKITSTTTK